MCRTSLVEPGNPSEQAQESEPGSQASFGDLFPSLDLQRIFSTSAASGQQNADDNGSSRNDFSGMYS